MPNKYDGDVTTWSEGGRLFQAEYAMEAVKQGSAVVGVKSNTHAVLVALKRAQDELSSYQEKVFHLDDHCGMAVSGLIADARYLGHFLRAQCMDHRYVYDRPFPVLRLADTVGDKYQRHTQQAGRRPFGVGLLMAGFDESLGTPRLVQAVPNGELHHFKATAMGARSQSARTYLEKHFDSFADCSVDDLVKHALKALANATSENAKLTTENTTVAVVGVDQEFTVFSDEAARKWLDTLVVRPEDRVGNAANAADASDEDEAH